MTLFPGVTVAIPSIPPRRHSTFHRAIGSVVEQTHQVAAISVAVDHIHAGAAYTRNKALEAVQTQWTAFLDDDDQLMPDHVERLMAHAEETGADMVYPWFTVVNGFDPFPDREGQPFDPVLLETRNTIPVTALVRTELIRDVGGFVNLSDSTETGASPCEDWNAWRKLVAAGARIEHLNRRTWRWYWGQNTSGRGDRW